MSKSFGILDPEGLNNNPLTDKPYENLYNHLEININNETLKATYKNYAKIWTKLLVYKKREEIIGTIKNNQVTLAKAGTGVGKTVLIPKFALHATDYKQKVLCTIPKKVITQETADFAAKCLDVKLGEEVGYYFKGTKEVDKNNKESKLIFTTTGSLLSRITGNDPLLSEYNVIIIDEAHERSVQTDLILLAMKNILKKRNDLKLVIMSATIDLDKFRNFYPKPEFKFGEVDAGEETTYEVKDYYLSSPTNKWDLEAVMIIKKILNSSDKGDILVFVKSGADGRKLCDLLKTVIKDKSINPFCIELESKSAFDIVPNTKISKKDFAINETLYKSHPDSDTNNPFTRKIVMSTNVAESSLTVKGIVYVIDTGLEFVDSYEPKMMARSLIDGYVAKSAVKQRRGRAGRTQEGECYHLYSKEQFNKFNDFPTPDIKKTDLSADILDLLRMDGYDTYKLRIFLNKLIDPPEEKFIKCGLRVLRALDCVDKEGKITMIGRNISKFRGIPPHLAKSLLLSKYYGCKNEMSIIVAMTVESDGVIDSIFKKFKSKTKDEKKLKKEKKEYEKIMNSYRSKYGDHLTFLNTWNAYKTYASVIEEKKEEDKQLEEYEFEKDEQEVIKEKSPGLRRWCLDNYLNYKKMSRIKRTSMLLRNIIRSVDIDKMLNIKLRNEDGLFDKLENRILKCLLDGCYINTAIKTRKNKYETIFPLEKEETIINRDSFLDNPGTYILYEELFLMKSGSKFNIVSTIPNKIYKTLNKNL